MLKLKKFYMYVMNIQTYVYKPSPNPLMLSHTRPRPSDITRKEDGPAQATQPERTTLWQVHFQKSSLPIGG